MNQTRKRFIDLCKQHGIEIIYCFGSNAGAIKELVEEGRQQKRRLLKGSDVDIGIKPSKYFDLVVLPEADPCLAANVIRGERLYCSNDHEADEYELYILRRAGDLAPLERERMSLIENR
jgi:hypothetical protein